MTLNLFDISRGNFGFFCKFRPLSEGCLNLADEVFGLSWFEVGRGGGGEEVGHFEVVPFLVE